MAIPKQVAIFERYQNSTVREDNAEQSADLPGIHGEKQQQSKKWRSFLCIGSSPDCLDEPETEAETFLKYNDTILLHDYHVPYKANFGERPSGGVVLLISNSLLSCPLILNTSLQDVATRIHTHSPITVFCLYLPPNTYIDQSNLNLMSQLPEPFIILGDFNGHNHLWGNNSTNCRGRQLEQVLDDHNFCLFNDDEQTYFRSPTKCFHVLGIAICSPPLYPFFILQMDKDLHNSDHFPLVL
ncbi:RNA-directed DNA polymerase mobile like protein [Argiope bruennichi]|uniref:RNA-directed DNA polymerase mobile like protein n=1 Tax=Argiope bruennichi TaxID=94029 RepID=A0A8T0F3G1_ARGBR|nr:RNA-directed DNA polymerase mobile like protein [Argiope bruennichi]